MATNSYVLSEKADADLEDIFDYTLEKFGFNQAVNYLLEIKETLFKIVNTPQIGRIRNEVQYGLYSFPIGSHIIFYKIIDHHIIIIRVLHASRDLHQFI